MTTAAHSAVATRNSRLTLASRLVTAYLVLSCATVALVVIFATTAPSLVTPEAWVRSIIVAATSVLTLSFAVRAERGRPRALLRLRIVVAILVVAIVAVLVFVPLPGWMLAEQASCGVLLVGVGILVFGRTASRRTELQP